MEDKVLIFVINDLKAETDRQVRSAGEENSQTGRFQLLGVRKEIDNKLDVFISFALVQGINHNYKGLRVAVGKTGLA
jgi:hypothetical protein